MKLRGSENGHKNKRLHISSKVKKEKEPTQHESITNGLTYCC